MYGSAVLFLILLVVLVAFLILALSESTKPKREYGVKSVTARGEEVRSIAERKIADYFVKNKINYVYEREAKGKFLFFDYKISSPDFYLPDYDVYVEYWGLVDTEDDKTRKQYVKKMKWKMAQYYQNKIKFISIYPDNLKNLDWIFRKNSSWWYFINSKSAPICTKRTLGDLAESARPFVAPRGEDRGGGARMVNIKWSLLQ